MNNFAIYFPSWLNGRAYKTTTFSINLDIVVQFEATYPLIYIISLIYHFPKFNSRILINKTFEILFTNLPNTPRIILKKTNTPSTCHFKLLIYLYHVLFFLYFLIHLPLFYFLSIMMSLLLWCHFSLYLLMFLLFKVKKRACMYKMEKGGVLALY